MSGKHTGVAQSEEELLIADFRLPIVKFVKRGVPINNQQSRISNQMQGRRRYA